MKKDVQIEVPEGYVIDEDRSTFSNIVFKEKKGSGVQILTEEQGREIAGNGFIGRFADRAKDLEGTEKELATLDSMFHTKGVTYPFMKGPTEWALFKPAIEKGVKRPWFGGDCPVDEDAYVVIYRRDGQTHHARAEDISWDRSTLSEHASWEVIAYIEL